MEKKFYTQVTVKTFYTDEDGVVVRQEYKSAMIPASDVSKLGEFAANRVKSIVENSIENLS